MKSATDNWVEVEAASRAVLSEDIVSFIEACRKGPEPDSQLISVLHRVQTHFGYLRQEHLDAVAQLMQIPAAKVAGVASFYHYFRLQPCGRFIVRVCMGTACYVKGAEPVMARFKQELGIDVGETSKDGLFTLEICRCIGTCGMAPVVMIDEEVYSEMTPDKVPDLLNRYIEKARQIPS